LLSTECSLQWNGVQSRSESETLGKRSFNQWRIIVQSTAEESGLERLCIQRAGDDQRMTQPGICDVFFFASHIDK
jgi:hypothetical protein